jgi:hypothetical protein
MAKLSKATVCLANLDEPLDPGVLIEIMVAKQQGIPTIGYRCDSRTPFGAAQSWNNGMHFFPLFQCDYFIDIQNVNTSCFEDSDKLLSDIVSQIDDLLKDLKPTVSS